MWFPWRSARNTADLYVTASRLTRLGGGLPAANVPIGRVDRPDGVAAAQDLFKPIGQGKAVRLWLGASLLQAGVLPSTANALKEQDLRALVTAELIERVADTTTWQIAVTQQADRSILWSASDQTMASAVRQGIIAYKLNLVSVAPAWSLIDGKNIAANAEALLWCQEVDAITGIYLKDGMVRTIAMAALGNATAEDAADRLRVRLAASEQAKELSVCLVPAIRHPAIGQDISAALLPESWQTLGHHKHDDPLNRKAA